MWYTKDVFTFTWTTEQKNVVDTQIYYNFTTWVVLATQDNRGKTRNECMFSVSLWGLVENCWLQVPEEGTVYPGRYGELSIWPKRRRWRSRSLQNLCRYTFAISLTIGCWAQRPGLVQRAPARVGDPSDSMTQVFRCKSYLAHESVNSDIIVQLLLLHDGHCQVSCAK